MEPELADALAALERRLGALERGMTEQQLTTAAELSSLVNLHAVLPLRALLPQQSDFTASSLTISALVREALSPRESMNVVECGSGSSTVWLAAACRLRGRGRVVALEHDRAYADETASALAANGLGDVADVRYAPLEPCDIAGERLHWYAEDAHRDLAGIDLLFVDGPPGSSGPRARFPAVPVLAERLADGALVVLDDADRPDEQQVLESWTAAGMTPGRLSEPLRVGRAAHLRWRRPAP